jgi:hypothetical protein
MRMATIKSKKLQEALKKARNVGRVEEPVTVDGYTLVLQNLTHKDYESIVDETTELENLEYYHAYQMGHVCRSIVEMDGVDLREVDFIEEDVPSGQYLLNATCSKSRAEEARESLSKLGIQLNVIPPDPSEGMRTSLVERHEWIRQRASSWSREAIGVLYRKFADVVAEGERRAREKVEFRVPDETEEDKFRRLLGELKEVAGQLPADLTKNIMEEAGYMPKSTPAELEEVARRAREFAVEQARLKEEVAAPPQAETPPPPAPPIFTVPSEPPPAPSQEAQPSPNLQQELMERLRNRVPMNRAPMQAPVPSSAIAPAGVPPQIHSAVSESRAAQIAALEGDVDAGFGTPEQAYVFQKETPELSRNVPQLDGTGVKGILDRPPVVGINPRFQRRPM